MLTSSNVTLRNFTRGFTRGLIPGRCSLSSAIAREGDTSWSCTCAPIHRDHSGSSLRNYR